MAKKSKSDREAILIKRFPEFHRLNQEFKSSIEAVIYELEETLDKLEDLQSKQEEVEDLKNELQL